MTEYALDEWVVQTPALSWPNTIRAAAVPVGGVFMLALCLLKLAHHVAMAEIAKVCVAIAVVAVALYLGANWLQSIGNWNLFIFFALMLGAGVLLGVPIAFCFGMATVAFLLTTTSTPLSVVSGRIDEGMSSLILLAVPLFILLGHLVEMTGMAKAMVDFLAALAGPCARRAELRAAGRDAAGVGHLGCQDGRHGRRGPGAAARDEEARQPRGRADLAAGRLGRDGRDHPALAGAHHHRLGGRHLDQRALHRRPAARRGAGRDAGPAGALAQRRDRPGTRSARR